MTEPLYPHFPTFMRWLLVKLSKVRVGPKIEPREPTKHGEKSLTVECMLIRYYFMLWLAFETPRMTKASFWRYPREFMQRIPEVSFREGPSRRFVNRESHLPKLEFSRLAS
jgi:hypothetical protein